jgi:hypothetical protein
MALGLNALLVAARVDLNDGASAADIERAATVLESALRDEVPDITEVFLDATPGVDRPFTQPTGTRAERR